MSLWIQQVLCHSAHDTCNCCLCNTPGSIALPQPCHCKPFLSCFAYWLASCHCQPWLASGLETPFFWCISTSCGRRSLWWGYVQRSSFLLGALNFYIVLFSQQHTHCEEDRDSDIFERRALTWLIIKRKSTTRFCLALVQIYHTKWPRRKRLLTLVSVIFETGRKRSLIRLPRRNWITLWRYPLDMERAWSIQYLPSWAGALVWLYHLWYPWFTINVKN